MSLRIIHQCLNYGIQVTKVGSFYSEILQIIYGVLQGLFLGPLLFNVNLIDLFLAEHYKSEFSDYTNDTTPYNCWNTSLETISDLEITLDNLFKWFCHHNFKANASKYHLLLLLWHFNAKSIKSKISLIEGSFSEKFLGITTGSNF